MAKLGEMGGENVNCLAVFVTVMLLCGVIGRIYAVWAADRRQAEMKRLAKKVGTEFHPNHVRPSGDEPSFLESLFSDAGDVRPFNAIEAFNGGRDREPTNTLHGQVDVNGQPRELWAGDWKYETGSGKNRKTHRYSYVLLALPAPAPQICLREEGLLDSIASAIGFNDLDFEHVGFSDAYHVRAEDDRFAYDLLHPRMIELFMARRPRRVQFGDGYLLLRSELGLWDPSVFRQQIAFAREVLSHWPRHLLAST